MKVYFDKLGIYNVNVDYLKYLHDNIDSEVYYASDKYNTKPFLGIIIGIGTYTYFIPFTSSKKKHLNWKNISAEYYLIYEIVSRNVLSKKAIYKPYDKDMVKHIIAVLDIKKMIPVPEGLYHRIVISDFSDRAYRSILEKEYRFCLNIKEGILARVKKIYINQKNTGKVFKYYCNFIALEKACDRYGAL